MALIPDEKSGFAESIGKGDAVGETEGQSVTKLDVAERNVSNSTPNSNLSSGVSATAPHPKKFSSVNINKKFLEKNLSAPSTSQSSSSATKSGTSNPKPVLQPTASHSRLVTTKLTTTLQSSSLTGPGWSRPSSATPGASTSNSPVPAGASPAATHAAPQLPHVGKVIQPQPRGSSTGRKEGSGSNQPVWGAVKGSANSLNTDVQNDFPTAAEVAQVRSARMVEKQEAAVNAAVQRQVQRAEADAFRGVHLDPNAHHWDEMEEDDDNFLGEVIDFGDGRQYTVQPVETKQEGPPEPTLDQHSRPPDLQPTTIAPVRKEDRFAEDFDRSWPRSRQGHPPPHRDNVHHAPPPPVQIQPLQSPQDLNSKVLFNERSNRLEPYAGRQNSSFPVRRGSRGDMPSPTDLRGGRDFPPHPQSQQNVQLLQKDGLPQRPQKFGSSEFPVLDMEGVKSGGSWREGHSPSSPMHSGRPPSQASHQEHGRRWSRDYADDPGRRGSFSSARAPSRDRVREPPPHMTMPPPRSPSITSRSPLLSKDDRLPPVIPSSPALSAHSLASSVKPTLSPIIDEEARQTAMHIAAERARIRRQEEEKDRESQKERARQKAAELEAKLNAEKEAKAEQERKAAEAQGALAATQETPEAPTTRPAWGRPPSIRGGTSDALGSGRPQAARRRSSNASHADPSPAAQTDSWRAKAAPLPAPPAPPAETPKPPPPPLAAEVDTLTLKEGEDVDVIDFSEFGKFVGAPEPAPPEDLPEHPSLLDWSERPSIIERHESTGPRHHEPPPTKSDVVSSWRRKADEDSAATQLVSVDSTSKTDEESSAAIRLKINPTEASNAGPRFEAQRSPRSNAFREASMSALDHAMSRIKGALDLIHDEPKESKKEEHRDQALSSTQAPAPPLQVESKSDPPRPRWLPPALRPRDSISNPFGLEEREDPVTIQLPQSPKPAWNTFVVRLPKESTAHGHLPKRQFMLSRTPSSPFRWDILSWNPPVEGMKRDFSLNDVLFRKTKSRPYVRLPPRNHTDPFAPKVNIPNRPGLSKVPSSGAFGRPRGADEGSSWRRPESTATAELAEVLVTISRSPPPVLPPMAGSPTGAEVQLSSTPDGTNGKSRNQPKMPVGSDIGFYRPQLQGEVAVETKGGVSFTVTSELDDGSGHASMSAHSEPSDHNSPVPGLVQSKTESKSSEASPEHAPVTPPLQPTNATWTKSPLTYQIKETTVRAPDPEHLKIVWSKSDNKDEMPSINSLEGIADDFTTVPFTLQDVKSEDGETPPPTVPSRMSLSEVTRAFQQVPSRPASTNPRHPSSLPSPALSTRQASYGLSPPHQQPNMRSTYNAPPYHSPVMSHSPAPVMYGPGFAPSSPGPARMMVNGHSPHYPPPVWVQASGGPAGQSPGPMMRPMASPFPAQLMYHPSPGPPMYAQMPNGHNNMPNHQPNGNQQGRGRGGPMMSPMLSPAGPQPHPAMYPSSPGMMPHGMPGYAPPPQPGAGRGQIRGFEGMSMMQASAGPPPVQPTYAPPMSSYRPPW